MKDNEEKFAAMMLQTLDLVSKISEKQLDIDRRLHKLEMPDATLEMLKAGRMINSRVTLEAWHMARELRAKGMTISAVARAVNRPRSTVQYLLTKTEGEIIRSLEGKRKVGSEYSPEPDDPDGEEQQD